MNLIDLDLHTKKISTHQYRLYNSRFSSLDLGFVYAPYIPLNLPPINYDIKI